MKIAVPVNNSNYVEEHYGHCDSYKVYAVTELKEISEVKNVAKMPGCGCKSGLAEALAADGVTVMLAGGIGGGASNKLMQNGIAVIRGCAGDASEAVKQYLAGALTDQGSSCEKHKGEHHHHHDHRNLQN